jgi:hypothetical protein
LAALPRQLTWLVIVVSLGLRLTLAMHGGQRFWPDEGRYDLSYRAAVLLLGRHPVGALKLLLGSADHVLFKVIAVLPALVEQSLRAPPWVVGFFFAIASTWMIWMVGRVALAAGGDEMEALIATFLAATTTSLFYYSRHFFPYDLSLGFFLVALARAFGARTKFSSSVAVGLWTSAGFLTYNGYWMVGFVVLAVHVLMRGAGFPGMLRRALGGLLGLALPIVALLVLARCLGSGLYESFLAFSQTVSQGDFGTAWRFIPEYFYVSEHALATLWGLALATALVLCGLRRAPPRLGLWLSAVLLLYGALVVPSDFLPRFAISARHARALAPFLSLLTAALLAAGWRRGGAARKLTGVILLAVGGQAGANFAQPLRQVFPPQFLEQANDALSGLRAIDLGPYEIIDCGFLHNPRLARPTPPGATVLLRREQPFQFMPYLYEGYSRQAREEYRHRDLSMRLVRLPVGEPPFPDYPGVIQLTLRFADRADGVLPEPLLATGKYGAGDVLYYRAAGSARDPDLVQIGTDPLGAGAVYSRPFRLDRTKDHVVVISMGSLFPPKDDPLFRVHPDWLVFKQQLYVTFDGEELLNTAYAAHEALRSSIAVGMNLIGATGSVYLLTAKIVAMERVPPSSLIRGLPASGSQTNLPVPRLFPGQAPRLRLVFPPERVGVTEPLFSVATIPGGRVVFVRYARPRHLRFGLSGPGLAQVESEEVEYDPFRPQTVILWAGPWATVEQRFADPKGAPWPADRRFILIYNDRTLIDVPEDFALRTELAPVAGEFPASSASERNSFSGRILGIDAFPYEALASWTAPKALGPVDLAIRFPIGREGASEPIVTTGRTGAGDFVYARYLSGGRVIFGFDHWGIFGAEGDPVALDYSVTHRLEVRMASLFSPRDLTGGKRRMTPANRVEVRLDGRVVLQSQSRCYPTGLEDIRIGANAIGGSTAGPKFTGQILSVRRPE